MLNYNHDYVEHEDDGDTNGSESPLKINTNNLLPVLWFWVLFSNKFDLRKILCFQVLSNTNNFQTNAFNQ